MTTKTKRFWMLAATLFLAGAAGACADEPMGVQEEAYEVQMNESTSEGNCIELNGVIYCKTN